LTFQGSRLVGLEINGSCALATLLEEIEVAIASHSRSAQIVLYDEHWDASVFRDHNRSEYIWPREDHVIAFLSHAPEAVEFKDANQDLIREWANPRHEGLRVAL
jgi:hypothetical protein